MLTVVRLESAMEPSTSSVPPITLVIPAKPEVPVSTVTPGPICANVPPPERLLAANVNVSERLIAKVPPSITPPASEPEEPPPPSCKVAPPLTVVLVAGVGAGEEIRVPEFDIHLVNTGETEARAVRECVAGASDEKS